MICRAPLQAILNAFHAHAIDEDVLDVDDYVGGEAERRLFERLFDKYTQAFQDLAREKILAGRFALSFGEVKSVLLGERELSRQLGKVNRPH